MCLGAVVSRSKSVSSGTVYMGREVAVGETSAALDAGREGTAC
jgi:hypothetical protein